ncbi:MAG: hypothetical protein K0R26_1964 [Bacteroidota bacterium]|jgi:hypothetical protein|nr:hypothetical protein [Bacteroidota bacterium]
MKLLSEDLLKEYGFIEKPHVANRHIIKIMTRDGIDIMIKDDGIYYNNLGFDYPLRDTAALRKLYKEIKNKDLKPLNPNIVS